MRRPSRAGDEITVSLGNVLDFMRVLWSLNHELDSMSKQMDTTFGVTGPQRLVLRIVGRMPGIAPGNLAKVLRVHPSTLTGILQRLVERDLVQRRSDPDDRRRSLLSLTPRGKAIDALRGGTVESAIQRALRTVTRRKLQVVVEFVELLTQTLEEERTRHRE